MTSTEIRESFLQFFREKGHTVVPSSPVVVPYDDPTLPFANAGMNQFKDVFLGTGRRPYTRVADTQKCIRVSGKHNDLEEVGRDTYHHTFFEMLGNWSFGDYYKKEAIAWAWELLTRVWKLPKERLWATVYKDDEEAEGFWKSVTDINPSHVLRFDEKDNFWEMGETGPCGPCSEIHIDRTKGGTASASLVNAGTPDVMEIWNLVFIQYNRDTSGKLTPLPAKHVDTGMGFERMCAVLQGKDSNYDTDLFAPIIASIVNLADKIYRGSSSGGNWSPQADIDVAIRVIADHARMLTFAIADGAMPSKKGRGAVLTKVLKRAARFGRILNLHEPFVYKLVDVVAKSMGAAFPELLRERSRTIEVIKDQEKKFSETEKNGFEYFYRNVVGEPIRQDYISRGIIGKSWWVDALKSDGNTLVLLSPDLSEQKSLNIKDELKRLKVSSVGGEDAFMLHATYGVHIDTIFELATEVGINVEREKYGELMEVHSSKSKEGSSSSSVREMASLSASLSEYNVASNNEANAKEKSEQARQVTHFVGYDSLDVPTKIVAAKDRLAILSAVPFYAESGGQVGDTGIIEVGSKEFFVTDTKKFQGAHVLIINEKIDGFLYADVRASVDVTRRQSIMRNHSATHLVHEALRRVLGTHLQQQGSLVAPDRLRFDFNHFQKITSDEIRRIEDIVNEKVADHIDVAALNDPKDWITLEEAKRKYPNVKMFFGDKYGDRVRIVEIDPKFSVELCGGTHVTNTREIGLFKIVSEGSIASGIRRIEAVTGEGLNRYIEEQMRKIGELDDHLRRLVEDMRSLEKELGISGKASTPPSDFDQDSARADKVSRVLLGRIETALHDREDAIAQTTRRNQELEKETSKHRIRSASANLDALIREAVSVNGFKLVSARVPASSMDELKSLGDALRSKLGSGIGLLASVIDEKVSLVCVVTDDLVAAKKAEAGKIVGAVARIVGGGGGGRAHMATAGGKDVSSLDEAVRQTRSIVESLIR